MSAPEKPEIADVPSWAWERLSKLIGPWPDLDAGGMEKAVFLDRVRGIAAELIAKYEQPPIDPLLVEAREIAAKAMKDTFVDVRDDTLARILSGEEDRYACVTAALAALRRGIELAREQQP